jgi:cell wall-associated NlpC family hydrolase
MRALATALTVAAVAFSAGLANPGVSHTATSAPAKDARAKGVKKRSTAKAAACRRKIARVVAFARRQIGVPYAWGGTSRRQGEFDCSGLVYAAFQSIGRAVPRTS